MKKDVRNIEGQISMFQYLDWLLKISIKETALDLWDLDYDNPNRDHLPGLSDRDKRRKSLWNSIAIDDAYEPMYYGEDATSFAKAYAGSGR